MMPREQTGRSAQARIESSIRRPPGLTVGHGRWQLIGWAPSKFHFVAAANTLRSLARFLPPDFCPKAILALPPAPVRIRRGVTISPSCRGYACPPCNRVGHRSTSNSDRL